MLSVEQMKCITLMVADNKTQKQIAKELNITEQTICNWKKQPEFREEIEKQIKNNFSLLAIEAQKGLSKLLKTKNTNVRMQAIKDVLDRAGFKPVERREITDDTEKAKKMDTITDILSQMQSVDDA